LIYWLCVVVASVLSIHERRSRNPCAVLADTRRLCLHVLFSFQRTDSAALAPESAKVDCPGARSPRLAGSQFATVGRFWGNLLKLLQPSQAVNTWPTTIPWAPAASTRGDVAGPWRRLTPTQMSKNLPSCVQLGSPGKPGSLGTDEPKEQSNIRAEGGCVNPTRSPMLEGYLSTLSAGAAPRRATHVKAASHTAANVHANPKQLTGSVGLLSNTPRFCWLFVILPVACFQLRFRHRAAKPTPVPRSNSVAGSGTVPMPDDPRKRRASIER
jgi:hypothetical protein